MIALVQPLELYLDIGEAAARDGKPFSQINIDLPRAGADLLPRNYRLEMDLDVARLIWAAGFRRIRKDV